MENITWLENIAHRNENSIRRCNSHETGKRNVPEIFISRRLYTYIRSRLYKLRIRVGNS